MYSSTTVAAILTFPAVHALLQLDGVICNSICPIKCNNIYIGQAPSPRVEFPEYI